jgi:RNA-directed DNA polymerase
MARALKQVRANKDAAGVDGMNVDELVLHLKEKWPRIRKALLEGEYQPEPVRRVNIPKPGGGTRMLGVVTSARTQGTPQGGPLSPLLSNILLDEFDKELESRGSKFCRYADDCNIYVHSRRAGERVKASMTRYVAEELKLKVNEKKSAVDRPWRRKFLGYSMTVEKATRLRAARESIRRLRQRLRDIFRGGRGNNIGRFIREKLNPVVRGWKNYFRLTEVKWIFEELDGWIRRRLRVMIWRQMKRGRTRMKRLRQRGLDEQRAWKSAVNGRGPWWNSGASHMNQAYPKRYFRALGLVELQETKL